MKKLIQQALCAVCLLPTLAAAEWAPTAQPATPVTDAPQIRATAADPIGDTFNVGPDLTAITAETDGTNLTLTLDFAGAIEPPPGTGGGIEVIGFIDIDTDQNGATGLAGGNVGMFCPMPPANFGIEFFVNLGSFDAMTNTVMVFDAAGMPVGTAPITYGATSLSVVVPNALIADDGIVNVNTVIGNIAAPTDCAPDGAVLGSTMAAIGIVTPVPALNIWGLALLIALAGIAGVVSFRRMHYN